jgi:hypothetical protein
MSGSVRAKRAVGLLVLAIAALLALTAALGTPEADAKKKKKINTVTCNTTDTFCSGTDGRDRLVGTGIRDTMLGEGGADIYRGNGGNDSLLDFSPTSSDTYTGYAANSAGFGADFINDGGGSSDLLDLGSLKMLDDVALIRRDVSGTDDDDLFLDGPGGNDVTVTDHFGQGRIEKIKFANGTITGAQVESLAREATPEEQTVIEEHFDEEKLGERLPEEERASQDEKHATVTPEKE